MKLPAKLSPADVVALVDNREQLPWDLSPMRSVPATLQTGDYTIQGCENDVRIERKERDDLLQCFGPARDRFFREMERFAAFPIRVLIAETSWQELERGGWRSAITPASAVGSTLGLIAQGVPVILAGDRERAQRYAAKFLFIAARREYRRLRAMLANVTDGELPAEAQAEVLA